MKIPITSIRVSDRQRIDHSNTDGLRESLAEKGTIQPIVLEKLSDSEFRLIAGGRRLHFIKELGHKFLYHGSAYNPERPGFVFGSELQEDQVQELELEENIRRKSLTWQEECIAIARLHQLKIARLGSKQWGLAQAGEFFGVSLGKIHYILSIANELSSSKDHPFWGMDGVFDAIKWKIQKAEEAARAVLVERQLSLASVPEGAPQPPPPEEKERAREQYLSNPLNLPEEFDSYWKEKQERPRVIPITLRLKHTDALAYLGSHPGCADHIITDPPYGIDMANLDQDNIPLPKVDNVRDEHDVERNKKLLHDFFPLAFSALRDRGFLCLWCDISLWDFLYQNGVKAGFSVQRWPVVWVKTHVCKNAMANHNFTKTTELVLVCRKVNTTLMRTAPLGHMLACHDDFSTQSANPFAKPFDVWQHLIEAVSFVGQTILDPFAGSGSSILAFARLQRQFLACESNKDQYNHLVENVTTYYRQLDPNTIIQ